ncbi:hypothetical protein [uncultured Ruegeria sp.]|uniref:hypothetical protein n=1 Tax=uncultured Ruegeria sp. TaxID=259304 RepID=UPI00260C622E|nr:hypothetical protein [uncultured Ruegeria sp.]
MHEATALRLVGSSELSVNSVLAKVDAVVLGLNGANVMDRANALCDEVVALIEQDEDGAILPCIVLRITDKRLQSAFLEAIGNRII